MTRYCLLVALLIVTVDRPALAQGFNIGGIGFDLSGPQPRFDVDLSHLGRPSGPPCWERPVVYHPVPAQPVIDLPSDRTWALGKLPPLKRPVVSAPGPDGSKSKPPASANGAAAGDLAALAKQGQAAFRKRNLGDALDIANRMVKASPKSPDTLQFRSLVHFASGDYQLSARDAYSAMLAGPLWPKSTMESIYGDLKSHQRDVRVLKLAMSEEPTALAPAFVLAYHQLMLENWSEARTALQTALRIKPDEPVATKLLQVVTKRLEQSDDVAAK